MQGTEPERDRGRKATFDFYSPLLKHVYQEKKSELEVKRKDRRLVLVHWRCSKHGRSGEGLGTLKPSEQKNK